MIYPIWFKFVTHALINYVLAPPLHSPREMRRLLANVYKMAFSRDRLLILIAITAHIHTDSFMKIIFEIVINTVIIFNWIWKTRVQLLMDSTFNITNVLVLL